jgi:hypothetical protein
MNIRIDDLPQELSELLLAGDDVRLHRVSGSGAIEYSPIPMTPNTETIEAMRAMERGEFVRSNSVEELLAELNAEED